MVSLPLLYPPWPPPSQLEPSSPLPPTTAASCPCNHRLGSLKRTQMEEIHSTTAHPKDLLGGHRRFPNLKGNRSIPATAGSITSHGGRVKLEHAGGERPFQIGPPSSIFTPGFSTPASSFNHLPWLPHRRAQLIHFRVWAGSLGSVVLSRGSGCGSMGQNREDRPDSQATTHY
jgi:hypothetical protein